MMKGILTPMIKHPRRKWKVKMINGGAIHVHLDPPKANRQAQCDKDTSTPDISGHCDNTLIDILHDLGR